MDDLISTRAAAELLGVGATAIKRWADEGRLACVRTAGGHRRFYRGAVLGLLNAASAAEGEELPRPRDPRLDEWIDALGAGGSAYRPEALLLAERAARGSWYRAAEFLGALLEDLGQRWGEGEVTIRQEHLISERLARTLAHAASSIPVPLDAPAALLVSAPGDEHTLGLSLVELCVKEAGWQSRWSGRATPVSEIVAAVEAAEVALVAASASSAISDTLVLEQWLAEVGTACQAAGAHLLLGGAGCWPESLAYGLRVRDFSELRTFLVGVGIPPRRPTQRS